MKLKNLHLLIGLTGVVAFVLSGQYMQWLHNSLQSMSDGPRLFFRSTHIYLMWSSLLNVLLGCYFTKIDSKWLGKAQILASIALLLGPIFLAISFIYEQHNPELTRPIAHSAIFLSFGAVLLQLLIIFIDKKRAGH